VGQSLKRHCVSSTLLNQEFQRPNTGEVFGDILADLRFARREFWLRAPVQIAGNLRNNPKGRLKRYTGTGQNYRIRFFKRVGFYLRSRPSTASYFSCAPNDCESTAFSFPGKAFGE
jgi:hypothetical protein